MAEFTKFESREAKLLCSPELFFDFITDLRNFDKFIPQETIRGWSAEAGSCKFTISTMGDVVLAIAEKTPYSRVMFSGTVLATIKFNLHALISSSGDGMAAVRMIMEADLPPMIRMFASGPINNFLETLVQEMEKFDSWKEN